MESTDQGGIRLIMAVSLESARPWEAYSGWDGRDIWFDRLAAVDQSGPDEEGRGWRDRLADRIKQRQERGLVVLVEDRAGLVCGPAARLMLDEPGDDGRANFTQALDWYFSLAAAGAIHFPPGAQRVTISSELVDSQPDDQGRTRYKPDWSRLDGGHRAVLLSVLGAVTGHLGPAYFQEFARNLKGWGTAPDAGPLASFHAVTVGAALSRIKKMEYKLDSET